MKTLTELARKYRDTEKLARYVERNPEAWDNVVRNEPAELRRMLDQLVRDFRWRTRQASTKPEVLERMARARAKGEKRQEFVMRKALLDWLVYGVNKALRDCTREDLEKSVASRRSQINAHDAAARFEARVAEELGNSRKTVGDVVRVERLSVLYAEEGLE